MFRGAVQETAEGSGKFRVGGYPLNMVNFGLKTPDSHISDLHLLI